MAQNSLPVSSVCAMRQIKSWVPRRMAIPRYATSFLRPTIRKSSACMLGNARAQDLIDTMQQQDYLSGQARYVNPRAGSPTAPRTAAMNALEAPTLPHWSPNLAEPLSFIPPAWIDALRPSTILQGGRNATYAGARQQLAPLLTQQAGPRLDDLLTAIRQETAARAAAAGRGANAARLTGALIADQGHRRHDCGGIFRRFLRSPGLCNRRPQ